MTQKKCAAGMRSAIEKERKNSFFSFPFIGNDINNYVIALISTLFTWKESLKECLVGYLYFCLLSDAFLRLFHLSSMEY